MDLEPSRPGVSLIAAGVGANERFFTCVGELVSLEVALGDELLVALAAAERTLSSVSSHVGFQISRFRKFFQTLFERAQ